MPTDRDSPSADWRRVYAEMGVGSDTDAEEEHRLDEERIDAYADEASAKSADDTSTEDGDEVPRHEHGDRRSRRESHA